MAKKKIVWTETAANQRRSVFEYWNENNKSTNYSEKLITQIKRRLDVLSTYPLSGKQTDFPNTLITSLGHYSILYQIKGNQIFVTGFWDNRKDPKKLYKVLSGNKSKNH